MIRIVITITKDEKTVKAFRLMKLMILAAKQGEKITVTAEEPDEDEAIASM